MIRSEKGQVVWRMTPDEAEELACELPPSWHDIIGSLFAAVDEIKKIDEYAPSIRIVVEMKP